MSEFSHLPQSPETPSSHDLKIIKALLGDKVAAKYEGTGGKEISKDGTYVPSLEELEKVEEATIESNRETKAEETKRLWMVWANKYDINIEEVKSCAKFQENGEVIWEGDCNWDSKGLKEFPPNFVEVKGSFICSANNLINLSGCDNKIGRHFNCSDNSIINLEGSPKRIIGNFYCNHNKLISLVGGPLVVRGNFICFANQLTSLEGGPIVVEENYDCSNNQLLTLEGCPRLVSATLDCRNNIGIKKMPDRVEVRGAIKASKNQIELIADLNAKGYFYYTS